MKNSLIKQFFLLFFMSCIISGCSSGNENTTSQTVTVELQNKIYMDEIGNMPILGTSSYPSYTVRIHNHSNTDYKLAGVKVLDLDTHKEQKDLLSVQSLTANQIVANQSSAIKILVNTKHSASAKLVLTLKDSHDKNIELEKIIRIANHAFAEQQIIGEKDFNSIANVDDTYTIALPILLAKTFDEVKSNEGKLECDSYKKGASCTLFLDGKISSKSQDIDLRLTGYHNVKKYPLNTKISVSYGNKPNLIFLYDSIINGSQTSTVTLTNNGTDDANSLGITTNDHNMVISNPSVNQCTNTLSANMSCQYEIKINGTSRSTEFKVSYQDSSQNTITSTKRILYFATQIQPRVTIALINGGLSDSLINTENSATFEIQNTGNSKLSNLTLRLPHSLLVAREFKLEPVPNYASSCKINSSFELAVNGSCQFVIRYTPAAIIQNPDELSLNLNGTYIDELGKQQNYFQILPISYSATNQVSPPSVSLNFKPGFSGNLNVPFLSNPTTNTFRESTVLILTNSSKGQIELEFNGTNPNFLTFSSTPTNDLDYSTTCSDILAGNASCEITINYGPGLKQETINDLTATVGYQYNSTTYTRISPEMILNSQNIAVASASLENLFAYYDHRRPSLNTNIHFAGGNGSIDDPYKIYAFNSKMLGGASYTISNVSATDFMSYNVLPLVTIGIDSLQVDSLLGTSDKPSTIPVTSCSTSGGVVNFISGAQCTYNVKFPDARNLPSASYQLTTDNWKLGDFTLLMNYSPTTGSGILNYNFNVKMIYFAVNFAWIDLDVTTVSGVTNPDQLTVTVVGRLPIPELFTDVEVTINESTNHGVTINNSICNTNQSNSWSCQFVVTRNVSSIDWSQFEFKVEAEDLNGLATFTNYKIFKGVQNK